MSHFVNVPFNIFKMRSLKLFGSDFRMLWNLNIMVFFYPLQFAVIITLLLHLILKSSATRISHRVVIFFTRNSRYLHACSSRVVVHVSTTNNIGFYCRLV